MWQGGAADSWTCKQIIVAQDLIERLSQKLGLPLKALGALTGAQLAGCQYRHPLFDRTSPVVIGGDYITTESGTGLVHTAPGHGQEDYQARALGSESCLHSCIHVHALHITTVMCLQRLSSSETAPSLRSSTCHVLGRHHILW